MILSSFCIILTKQQTLSVTRPFDSSQALYYKRHIVTMRLSCTVMEIWRLKDNGVTSLTFLVTWPFDSRVSSSYGWSIVTMRPCATVTEIWRLKHKVTSLIFWGRLAVDIDIHGYIHGYIHVWILHFSHPVDIFMDIMLLHLLIKLNTYMLCLYNISLFVVLLFYFLVYLCCCVKWIIAIWH